MKQWLSDVESRATQWLRPSIQQPRIISNLIKGATYPLVASLEIVKAFWQTWHEVYRPDKKKD